MGGIVKPKRGVLHPVRCKNVSEPDNGAREVEADAIDTVPSAKESLMRPWIESSKMMSKGCFHEEKIHDIPVVIAKVIGRGRSTVL